MSEDKLRVLKDITAGTVGGIAQTLAGNPFDTVKVRLQSSKEYSGPIDVIQKLIKNEGFKGFYKGVTTPLVGVGACVSIQFAVNESMKRFFKGSEGKKELKLWQFYTCGAAAGFSNGFLASPIEHIRIRLQTQTSSESVLYKGPIDCIKKIYSNFGIKGIYKGLGPTLWRESHGMGIYFCTYEFLVHETMKKHQIARESIEGYKLCSFGAISGVTLWLMTYPIDVVKTKFQTDDFVKKIYKTTWQSTKLIYKTGGLRAFFNGFSVCIIRAAPANAVTFYAFELTMRFLG